MATFSKTHVLDLESGSSQYVRITDAAQVGLDLTSSFTIMFWAKKESNPANNNRHTFVSKYDSANGGYEINHFVTGGGVSQIEVRIRQSAGTEDVKNINVSALGVVAMSVWHHYAVVANYSGGALSLIVYVDGFDRNGAVSGTTTSIAATSKEFAIGARSDGSNFYDGLMSDVKVFNAAQTQGEVVAHMRHYRNVDSTKGQWRLNNSLSDAGPSGNTLTAVASAGFASSSLPFETYGRTTRFFCGPGDGFVSFTNAANWDTAHDSVSGDEVDDTTAAITVEISKPSSSALRTIRRAFLPFETNVDANIQVLAAAVGAIPGETVGGSGNTGTGLSLVQTTQSDPTNLVLADFSKCGSVDGAQEGAARRITADPEAFWNMNSTGVSWITLGGYTLLGVRIGRDIDDDNPTQSAIASNTATIPGSETAGQNAEAFLDVIDDDEFYGGTTGSGGVSQAGAYGGVDLGGGSGADPGEYVIPSGGGSSGGIGGSGEAGASNENTVALAGISFVE
jgi:hypothetical protein